MLRLGAGEEKIIAVAKKVRISLWVKRI